MSLNKFNRSKFFVWTMFLVLDQILFFKVKLTILGKKTKVLSSIFKLKYFLRLGYLGLEPRTYRLKADYSTIELATHNIILP
jgi:hypothetical protein